MKINALTLLLALGSAAFGGVPSPVITSTFPAEPNPPANLSSAAMQPYFDSYAWQAMIALCWPASAGDRGVPAGPNKPETFLSAKPDGRVVWTTYRTVPDLFPPKGETPPSWNGTFRLPFFVGRQKISLASFHKQLPLPDSKDPGLFNQAFGGPLIDQHGNYTLFNEYVNQTEYDFIKQKQWYNRDTLTKAIGNAGVTLPNGSIELKGSWRPLTAEDDASLFYTVIATIPEPTGDGSKKKTVTMGLVGLHISVKTPSFPQWLWATFEQVNNVKAKTPGAKASYNSGHVTNAHGYDYIPKVVPPFPATPNKPVEVNRVTPLSASTIKTNAAYQALLKGTVWANYELIALQWPTQPGPTKYAPTFNPKNYNPSVAGEPFPPFLANTTMETYFQGNDPCVQRKGNTSNSCMQCHYHAAAFGTDYSWALYNHAQPGPPAAGTQDPVVKDKCAD